MSPPETLAGADLKAAVEDTAWYHTLELPGGIVTPGWFDTREAAKRVPLPTDLSGKRCLDIGTWDGFWAFQMESRGASEVVAIDLDDPERWDWPGDSKPEGADAMGAMKAENRGFSIARDAFGSSVDRRDVSVYELDPEDHGVFDVVFLGSLLLHLRDPVAALMAIRKVTRGSFVLCETIDPFVTIQHPRVPVARLEGQVRPWWWQPNVAAVRRMVESAGFVIADKTRILPVRLGAAHPRPSLRRCNPLTIPGRNSLVNRLYGLPHTSLRATPSGR